MKSSKPSRIWLTSEEAAEYLGISEKALIQRCYRGQVPYYKFGRRNRYLRAELDATLRKTRIDKSANGGEAQWA